MYSISANCITCSDFIFLYRDAVLKRIENVVATVIRNIAEDVPPVLTYPSTSSWRDTEYDCNK